MCGGDGGSRSASIDSFASYKGTERPATLDDIDNSATQGAMQRCAE
jgi:hypothetical protein